MLRCSDDCRGDPKYPALSINACFLVSLGQATNDSSLISQTSARWISIKYGAQLRRPPDHIVHLWLASYLNIPLPFPRQATKHYYQVQESRERKECVPHRKPCTTGDSASRVSMNNNSPWTMAGGIVFIVAVVGFTIFICWEWRRDGRRGEIELVNNTRLRNREGQELGNNYAPAQDGNAGATHGWPPLQPLRRMDLEAQEDIRGRATSQFTSPLGPAIQGEERALSMPREDVEYVEREMENGDVGSSEQARGPRIERIEEESISNNPTSSSSPPRLLITIPTINFLSRLPKISSPSSNPSPSPSTARQYQRSFPTADRISQPPPSPGSQSTSAHERVARPASQATLQRYASVGTNDEAGSSRPYSTQMYTDSLYTVSTLPSYPNTAKSPRPPPYLYLARTRSGHTTRSHVIPTSGADRIRA